MARSINQLITVIETEILAKPELSDLTSPSQKALWRAMVYVWASVLWAFETMWDYFFAEVKAYADSRPHVGTIAWYAAKAKEFQYSVANVYWIDFNKENEPVYNIIEPNDRLVKYSAAIEGSYGILTIKAAKDDNGSPAPLDIAEMQAFRGYMDTIKMAGTIINYVSLPADLMSIIGEVYFNPQANEQAVRSAVETAITSYLKDLFFNGIIHVEKLRDVIQKVPNVVDVKLINVSVNYGNGNVSVDRFHATLAGYARINPLTPLNSTLIFVASYV